MNESGETLYPGYSELFGECGDSGVELLLLAHYFALLTETEQAYLCELSEDDMFRYEDTVGS